MLDDEILEMYEKNQELIDELWEDYRDDELEVKSLVFNYDPTPYPFPL